jgi:hypothetical protein
VTKVIALDDGLLPVKNYLKEQGCQIINIDAAKNLQVDAVILSGMSENFLGIEDIMIDAPVINAKGMTPEEMWRDIQQIEKQKQ